MDRKEFLASIAKGSALIVLSSCLYNCGGNGPTAPDAPSNVDFTIDITQNGYTALQNVGGSIYKDGIIVAHTDATTFVAVSQACTHQGTTVQLQESQHRFHCPNHGSNFNLNGSVINGPASSPLRRYNVTVTGNNIRVYS